jgi:hypothetical protein
MTTFNFDKEANWLRLPHILLIAALSVAVVSTASAYHYMHATHYDEEGIRVIADPHSACEAAHKTAVENCREQLEEAWFNDGAHYYTREQMKRDLPICNSMGDAVYASCISYGQ